jgi:dGTPase
VNEVRRHGQALVAFPPEAAEAEALIKAFLRQRMYRHPRVMHVMDEAEALVRDLFARYRDDPAALPAEWLPEDGDSREFDAERARRIGNFIAGMTDRFAITEHLRLFDSTPELR